MDARRNFGDEILRCAFLLCLLSLSAAARGQQQPRPTPTPQEPDSDVISINTDLVQTDVVVLDRAGRFVGGLQRDQFELRVDAKPQTISFFERVTTGSDAEESQLAAGRGKNTGATRSGTLVQTTEQRRVIGFFVDDLHLTAESIQRTRKLLLNFIDNKMRPGDQVLIASVSGQIGFLQQFTESREALRAAVARLRYQSQSKLDTSLLPMTVYEAQAIDRNDWGIINRKVNEVVSNYSTGRSNRQRLGALRLLAEQEVRNTARQMLRQATQVDKAVLSTLESLARGSAAIRGRKLVFFISEGFIPDKRYPEVQEILRRLIDVAARGGVVIYTVDARGLFAAFSDASTEVIAAETHSETLTSDATATQEIMRTLASDTGGRAILNNNDLEAGIGKALQETSAYYLLAWRPERIEQGKPVFRRIEVSIKGRPELSVLARSGFLETPTRTSTKVARANNEKSPANLPHAELNTALNTPYALRGLRLSLYPTFTNDAERGSVLTIAAQLSGKDFEAEEAAGDRQLTDLDIACVVLNQEGKSVSNFGRKLGWTPEATDAGARGGKITTEFNVPLPPGLYQIRLAARDNRNGRTGSAFQWIEIPEFVPKRLSLSSLFLSEQKIEGAAEKAGQLSQPAALNVERTFTQSSRLLLQTYIYNGARASGGAPQITMQLNIFHHHTLVASAPAHLLSVNNVADLTRIPYAVPIPLKAMPTGLYTLQVTASDQVANTTATQIINFTIK
jgi:VWFA-related protein